MFSFYNDRRHLGPIAPFSLPWHSLVAATFSAVIWLLFCAPAMAAESAATSPDGRVAGIIAGSILLSLVIYAILRTWQPLFDEAEGGSNLFDSGLFWALLLLSGITLIKLWVMPFFPGLGIDIGSYEAWASRMADVGPARMYERGYFLDYPPAYLYALWACGWVVHATGANDWAQRLIVESPAIIADFFLGATIYAVLRRYSRPALAYLGLFVFALNPALLFDSVVWGQSDSVLTLVMLLSVLMIIEEEYELAWGLAAVAVLIKPQGLMLVPVLGIWTLLKSGFSRWAGSAIAALGMALITIAPFQINQHWNWIFQLYNSTAAYYHETSVNAFNLMALAGGLRQADESTKLLGLVSFFYVGMTLLVLLYAWLAYMLWRKPTQSCLMYSCFLALFGFFMVAPRMHERYLYPAIVFLIPMALEEPVLGSVLTIISITFLYNLASVKNILEINRFYEPHEAGPMMASAMNVVALGLAGIYAVQNFAAEQGGVLIKVMEEFGERIRRVTNVETSPQAYSLDAAPLPWITLDYLVIGGLLLVAIVTRFWHLGQPAEIVFDEVHFVGQARHYLHAESFLDPHPPLAKLLIAVSIWIFGDHSFAWRVPNALIGTALVAITYLLGRRMFASRLAAAFAAGCVLLDGMFLVDSRIGVLDIVYCTLAALSYLCFFHFAQARDLLQRRRMLVWLGLALGLCLSAKLYIPAITFLLICGFIVYVLIRAQEPASERPARKAAAPADPVLERRIGGALALVSGVAAIVYLAVFLPHYFLGWWGGISDLFKYYKDVMWYEQSVSSASHPYAAPWWSWPLLLRPIAYWQNFPANAALVATIWGGGNPAIWWGALTGVGIFAVQAWERKDMTRAFVVIGYAAYLAIWIPIGRTLFLYHYMPSVYMGFLALAAITAECWQGNSLLWEEAALLFTLFPVAFLGFGGIGILVFLAAVAGYVFLLSYPQYKGKYVSGLFVLTTLGLFVYFFPVWTGIKIARDGYYARMWLQTSNTLWNWI